MITKETTDHKNHETMIERAAPYLGEVGISIHFRKNTSGAHQALIIIKPLRKCEDPRLKGFKPKPIVGDAVKVWNELQSFTTQEWVANQAGRMFDIIMSHKRG